MRGRASWFVEGMLALVLSCDALLAGALTLGLAATIGFSSWSNDNSHSRLQFTPAGEPYVWHAAQRRQRLVLSRFWRKHLHRFGRSAFRVSLQR